MFLTDFADAAVTLPLAALAFAILLVGGGVRAAIAWLLATGGAFAAVLVLKLGFGLCWPSLARSTGVVSPSGHTVGATVVYAGLARVLGTRRRTTLLLAVVVAVAVGTSRVVLGMHTPAEAALGAAIGLAATAVLLAHLPPGALSVPRWRAVLVAGAVLVIGIAHGRHAPFERVLQHWLGGYQSSARLPDDHGGRGREPSPPVRPIV